MTAKTRKQSAKKPKQHQLDAAAETEEVFEDAFLDKASTIETIDGTENETADADLTDDSTPNAWQRCLARCPWLAKRPWLIGVAVVVVLLLIVGVCYAAGVFTSNDDSDQSTPAGQAAVDQPVTAKSRPRLIDGALVNPTAVDPTLRCVMIDNADFEGARPQSGLQGASVVYEVIVEGGITRFMAVFTGDENQALIGPVRSARDTYLEFVSEYNCAYTHAGGSFTAMNAIWNFELRDLDGLRESNFFWREASKYAPHDLFTSTEKLTEAVDAHSWETAGGKTDSFEAWSFIEPDSLKELDDDLRKATAKFYVAPTSLPDSTPGTTVSIAYNPGYEAGYTYNETTKTYERSTSGTPHQDAATDTAVSVTNVVIQHVGEALYVDDQRVNWAVTGEGTVDILHHGQHYTGTWKKADRTSRTQFFAADGTAIPLQVGNTWISIVPTGTTVTIQ